MSECERLIELKERIRKLTEELNTLSFKLTPSKGPILTLTLAECESLTKCPYLEGRVSENNYPGYNTVVDKIFDFVDDNRKS